MKDDRKQLEELHQYVTYRLRRLINKQKKIKYEIDHLCEYRNTLRVMLEKEDPKE